MMSCTLPSLLYSRLPGGVCCCQRSAGTFGAQRICPWRSWKQRVSSEMCHIFPVIVDTGKLYKPHQSHKRHVGLKLLNSDFGPAGKFSAPMHSRANWLLCSTTHQKSWGEEAGKDAYRGGRDWHFWTSCASKQWDVDCFK